jgi:hypothetical protein
LKLALQAVMSQLAYDPSVAGVVKIPYCISHTEVASRIVDLLLTT